MNTKMFLKRFLQSLLLIVLTLVAAKVQAEKVEEISYDDLVNRLNKKKSQYSAPSGTNLDDIALHAGAGLVSSFTTLNVNGTDFSRQINGFQISFGIDLFHPSWMAEGALRNFGNTTIGSETLTLRENDLKVLYRAKVNDKAGFRAGTGLSTRSTKYENRSTGADISESTPSWIFFGGLEAYVNKSLSLGIEGGYRSSMISRNSDKGAIDMMVRLDTHF